jgi:hypothetical protein
MADFWNTDWLTRSPMFGPLRGIGARLPSIGWPDCALLDALADESGRVVNARGQRLRFVAQAGAPRAFEDGFEPRTYLRGELQVRPLDWHDLFNALVWMAFPTAKAAINARHYESLAAGEPDGRPPARDALTLFDEEGVVVLSSDARLLDLIREFRWKELFWTQRERVGQRMRFLVFGHALYRKALDPFVGMTGKAVLLEVPAEVIGGAMPALVEAADRRLALHIWDRNRMSHGRELHPLPVLGVPGWWPASEREDFYDDASYFRPGRRAAPGQPGTSPSM